MSYATLLHPDLFAKLTEAAVPLVEKARAMAVDANVYPKDISVPETALYEEAQGLVLAFQAVLAESPLTETAVIVALGAVCGAALAQIGPEHRGRAFDLIAEQTVSTYEAVIEASYPEGTA